MRRFTPEDVVNEAQRRWVLLYPFDINPEEWERIARRYNVADIFTAISKVNRRTRSLDPEVVHESLVWTLERLDNDRQDRVAFLHT